MLASGWEIAANNTSCRRRDREGPDQAGRALRIDDLRRRVSGSPRCGAAGLFTLGSLPAGIWTPWAIPPCVWPCRIGKPGLDGQYVRLRAATEIGGSAEKMIEGLPVVRSRGSPRPWLRGADNHGYRRPKASAARSAAGAGADPQSWGHVPRDHRLGPATLADLRSWFTRLACKHRALHRPRPPISTHAGLASLNIFYGVRNLYG